MKRKIFKSIMFLGIPFTYLSSLWLLFVKKVGESKYEDNIFMKLGILPVIDHYYQPLINPKKHLTKSLKDARELPGIDFNEKGQLEVLARFNYNDELLKFPIDKTSETAYYYMNMSYGPGDAEYLYNVIRFYKPKKILEIGSGNSTMMAKNARDRNKMEDPLYSCRHICIEPYEMPWLEKFDVELVREKVENVDKSLFLQLEANDILFIDSTHVIRPQGDVLFEYLEILPTLKKGVLVHIHDIFTPQDYPETWVYAHRLWNEQYLLEAFLTFNNEFKIIGALNYLGLYHEKEFSEKCPVYGQLKVKNYIGGFWMVRV